MRRRTIIVGLDGRRYESASPPPQRFYETGITAGTVISWVFGGAGAVVAGMYVLVLCLRYGPIGLLFAPALVIVAAWAGFFGGIIVGPVLALGAIGFFVLLAFNR